MRGIFDGIITDITQELALILDLRGIFCGL
jgi:hypothetical protein